MIFRWIHLKRRKKACIRVCKYIEWTAGWWTGSRDAMTRWWRAPALVATQDCVPFALASVVDCLPRSNFFHSFRGTLRICSWRWIQPLRRGFVSKVTLFTTWNVRRVDGCDVREGTFASGYGGGGVGAFAWGNGRVWVSAFAWGSGPVAVGVGFGFAFGSGEEPDEISTSTAPIRALLAVPVVAVHFEVNEDELSRLAIAEGGKKARERARWSRVWWRKLP